MVADEIGVVDGSGGGWEVIEFGLLDAAGWVGSRGARYPTCQPPGGLEAVPDVLTWAA